MDGSLSSSRQYNSRGGDSSYHNRRRGGGGRGGGGYNRRNENRYQPYNRNHNSRGRGGYDRDRGHRPHRNSSPGNRFDNNTRGRTKSVDPQEAMLKQLSAMVATMGDLTSFVGSFNTDTDDDTNEDGAPVMRGVVKGVSKNINDLANVLCSVSNAPLFLKFQPPTNDNDTKIQAAEEAGPLATLVTSCAAALPLQSTSYVGLTVGVELAAPEATERQESQEQKEESAVSYKGFSNRSVVMACRKLAVELDAACGVSTLNGGEDSAANDIDSFQNMNASGCLSAKVHAFVRAKLLLRYLALLARVGIVSGHHDHEGEETFNWDREASDNSSDQMSNLSIEGLLHLLLEAATRSSIAFQREQEGGKEGDKSACKTYQNVSVVLSMLVLSTIPYTLSYFTEAQVQNLLGKIDLIMTEIHYKSSYEPGNGSLALLLKSEQIEESITVDTKTDDDEDEEEEDDSDDDDDDEATPVCADNFQDLIRTIRKLVALFYGSESLSSSFDSAITKSTRFALFSDAPWQGLDENSTYTFEKISINLPEICRLIPLLFAVGCTNNSGDDLDASVSSTIALHSLEGILFGRLSIFDPPPTDDDDDDDNDDGDNDESNLEEDAYVKGFSLIDRCFLSEIIRECLICHQSNVSGNGLEKGTSKDVAVQIWAVRHLFINSPKDLNDAGMDDGTTTNTSSGDLACRGVEYGIVETILSLIIQAPRGIESTSPLSHVYLSRVLLALTKDQPSRVPQCLAIAVSVLLNDFIPSMSPISRDNLSYWFSFHLTNTDYQWPHTHWVAWTPFVVNGTALQEDEKVGSGDVGKRKRNSRGELVASVIQTMVTYVSSPQIIVRDCLPDQSPLCDFLLFGNSATSSNKGGPFASIESTQEDIDDRIWKKSDDPEAIRDYMIGDEAFQSIQQTIDDDDAEKVPSESSNEDNKIWWRTRLIVQSLLRPVIRDNRRLIRTIEMARKVSHDDNDDNDAMDQEIADDDDDMAEDALTDVVNSFSRYKAVILATLAKDILIYQESLDLRGEMKSTDDTQHMGEVYILRQCEKFSCYSTVLLESCVETCVKHEIVSGMGVLWWVLDERNNNESENECNISPQWYKFASLALRIGVRNILSSGSTVESLGTGGGPGGEIGMIIDSGGSKYGNLASTETPSTKIMKKVTDYAAPLLNYVVSRVDKLLDNMSNVGRKRMLPLEVDLQEGLKYLVRTALSYIISSLKNDPIVKSSINEQSGGSTVEVEVEKWVAKCELGSATAE